MRTARATVTYVTETITRVISTHIRRRRRWEDKAGNKIDPAKMTTEYLKNAFCTSYNSPDPVWRDRSAYIAEELGRRATRYFDVVRGTKPDHSFYEGDDA